MYRLNIARSLARRNRKQCCTIPNPLRARANLIEWLATHWLSSTAVVVVAVARQRRGKESDETCAHSSLFLTTMFVRSESDDVEEGAVVALIDDDDNKAFEASFVSAAGVEVAGLGRPWCDGLLVAW